MVPEEWMRAMRDDRGVALCGVRTLVREIEQASGEAERLRSERLAALLHALVPGAVRIGAVADAEVITCLAVACEHWGFEWPEVDADLYPS